MAEVHGNRIGAENARKTAVYSKNVTKTGALSTDSIDYDLQTVIDAWHDLADETRDAILAMIAADLQR